LKERRTPILGDEAYGNTAWNQRYQKLYGIQRPLLHAYETRFHHPYDQSSMCLQAPLPADIRMIIDQIIKNSHPFQTSSSSSLSNKPSSSSLLQIYDPITHLLTMPTNVPGILRTGGSMSGSGRRRSSSQGWLNDFDNDDENEDDNYDDDDDDYSEEEDNNNNTTTEEKLSLLMQKKELFLNRGTSIIRPPTKTNSDSLSSSSAQPKYYVPSDRLKLEDDEHDWMKYELPEFEEEN
jgi:hypothetical protein